MTAQYKIRNTEFAGAAPSLSALFAALLGLLLFFACSSPPCIAQSLNTGAGDKSVQLRDKIADDSADALQTHSSGTGLVSLTRKQPDSAELRAFKYPQNNPRMESYFWLKFGTSILSTLFVVSLLFYLLEGKRLDRFLHCWSSFSGTRRGFREALLFFLIFYGFLKLLRLPFTFFSSYLLEHEFGLSNQSLLHWFRDELLMTLVSGIAFVTVAFLAHLILRKMHSFAFLGIWALLSLGIISIVYMDPLLIDPLFNKFRPMPGSELRQKIESLCRKSGIEHPLVLVADKSKQTLKLNAYVTGIGSSHRIVLFDTLVEKLPEDEVAAVLAHELGHYRLKHVLTGTILSIVSLLPVLYFAERLLVHWLPVFKRRWGLKSKADALLIVPVYILLALVPLVISPIPSFISRLFESEADAYAIRLTGLPLASARSFVSLARSNNSLPDPPAFMEIWFYSHPSLKHRIDYALAQLSGERNCKENN